MQLAKAAIQICCLRRPPSGTLRSFARIDHTAGSGPNLPFDCINVASLQPAEEAVRAACSIFML